MSFPPNNPLFPPRFPPHQPNVPAMPRFSIPLGGLPLPIPVVPPPMSMGVTVPAGVTSISAPPVRNQNTAVISAPPVISMTAGPPTMLFSPAAPPMLQNKTSIDPNSNKKLNITTVFVGNITDRASDMLIRQLLSKCGTVHNWKRIQGPDGKLQAFGFCDYADPESAMRSIRLLHDFHIYDKKLIVKVDAKTQEKLDQYNKDQKDNNKDDEMMSEDKSIKITLQQILKEHEVELTKEPESNNKVNKRFNAPKDAKNEDLSELDMEDDKLNLINREIYKFRDTYKKYDEDKEEEKRKKEEERSRRNDRRRSRSRDRDDSRIRSRKSRDRDRDRGRDRSSKGRDRRSPSFEADRDLDHHRERSMTPVDEEEMFMRKRREEQIIEKDLAYRKRLRVWEAREKRKAKDYERDKLKEERRKKEEEIEKQKLKQFLQDYDDLKHDEKYYSGKALLQRQSERRKEMEQDTFEREQERRDLEELRKKLNKEGHPDPESEVRKQFNFDDSNNQNQHHLMDEQQFGDEDSQGSMANSGRSQSIKTFGFAGMKITTGQTSTDNPHISSNGQVNNNDDMNNNNDHGKNNFNKEQFPNLPSTSSSSTKQPNMTNKGDKRKKLMTVSEVFNSNEDDDLHSHSKKRRPPPNALLEDSNTDSNLSATSKQQQQLTSEEKRMKIKNLIDTIPTNKDELFNYEVDWDLLDDNLMENRIRKWIAKKIKEYIGEEEASLIDFICKKVLTKCSASSLLDNLTMVLDDEAQVFVLKLWRLLIYEIEAKKLGLTKG